MVLEFIIGSGKFIAIFLSFFYILMFCLFKINVGLYKYYYYRSQNLKISKDAEFNNIKLIFNPVFKTTNFKTNILFIKTKAYKNLGFVYENDKISFIKE